MQYKASLDNTTKTITTLTFILFVAIVYLGLKALLVAPHHAKTILIYPAAGLVFIVVIIGSYFYAPKAYQTGNGYLTIIKQVGEKKIKLADIAQIRMVTADEMFGAIGLFGVGGVFGYYGKYYVPKIGSVTLYATQRKNRILIITRQGNKMIITPDDAGMIDDLKKNLAAG